MFARPDVPSIRLQMTPVLESWNARQHPDQLRLSAFLDHVEATVPETPDSHAVLELNIGFPSSRSLTAAGGDLDNYLFPIARRLGAARFDAMFGSKSHAEWSSIAIAPSRELEGVPQPNMRVRTTAAASTRAWKEEVRAACQTASPRNLPTEGPIDLDLEFRVSPARNWSSLWKPAIDALGPLLGYRDPTRPFAPRDDRIVRLGLHRVLDPSLGWDIMVSAWWTTAGAR